MLTETLVLWSGSRQVHYRKSSVSRSIHQTWLLVALGDRNVVSMWQPAFMECQYSCQVCSFCPQLSRSAFLRLLSNSCGSLLCEGIANWLPPRSNRRFPFLSAVKSLWRTEPSIQKAFLEWIVEKKIARSLLSVAFYMFLSCFWIL